MPKPNQIKSGRAFVAPEWGARSGVRGGVEGDQPAYHFIEHACVLRLGGAS